MNPPDVTALNLEVAAQLDVASAGPAVRVPTLVLHRRDNRMGYRHKPCCRSRISNARFVEFPGSESDIFLGDTTRVLEEIQSFLREEHPDFTEDRPLATVLFTDIVASTEQLSTVGYNAWRHILDDHDNTVDGAVAEHRGRVIKGLGDGILATFGPSGSQRTRDSQCDRRTRHGSARRIAHG
jgi:class 3 adenylate cyclase